MSPIKLSVVLCTHNPEKKYMDRVLEALRNQTLPKEEWCLVLVDNASDTPVASQWDLGWHPHSIYLNEPRPGITYARLAGISAARYPWIVFVDDDNVLAPDYLQNACEIAEKMPFLGVFSGKISGEFEKEPPEWMKDDMGIIAVRDLQKDIFSSIYIWDAVPAGAGMVIKRTVAEVYLEHCRNHPIRQTLIRGEDTDMVLTAIDMGYAIGRFTKLEMTHLIRENRLQKEYILTLCESSGYSEYILSRLWDNKQIAPAPWHFDLSLQIYRLFFESYYAFQKGNRRILGRIRAKRMLKKSGLL